MGQQCVLEFSWLGNLLKTMDARFDVVSNMPGLTTMLFDRRALQFDDSTTHAKLLFWLLPHTQQPKILDNPRCCPHGERRSFNMDCDQNTAGYGDVYAYLDVRFDYHSWHYLG